MGVLDAALVAIHVPAGAIAALCGFGAMIAPKGGAAHRRRGRAYLLALVVVCATGVALVFTRGPRFLHLAPLGIVAALLGLIGYTVRRQTRPFAHVTCMAFSFIAMLTAFYVDNGPKLPGWNLLPPSSFWVLPTLIGTPLIVLGLRRSARRSEHREPPGS